MQCKTLYLTVKDDADISTASVGNLEFDCNMD